jgi:hypothetical protein
MTKNDTTSTVTLGDVQFDPVETQDFRLSVEGTSGTGKSNTLAAILEDLADVAMEIDELRDDWHTHPGVGMGSYGPDKLGNCYISVSHTDEEVLDGINTDGLPVEVESVQHWSERGRSSDFEEHYTLTLRHERYYDGEDEEDAGYGEYAEEAEEISLQGSNIGYPSSITADLAKLDIEYEEVDELDVRNHRVWLYKYEKEGETRWAAEWTERIAIDDVAWTSLVFSDRPDADDVSQAALIEDAISAEK